MIPEERREKGKKGGGGGCRSEGGKSPLLHIGAEGLIAVLPLHVLTRGRKKKKKKIKEKGGRYLWIQRAVEAALFVTSVNCARKREEGGGTLRQICLMSIFVEITDFDT